MAEAALETMLKNEIAMMKAIGVLVREVRGIAEASGLPAFKYKIEALKEIEDSLFQRVCETRNTLGIGERSTP